MDLFSISVEHSPTYMRTASGNVLVVFSRNEMFFLIQKKLASSIEMMYIQLMKNT